MGKILLSIEQDECTSCGKCPEIAPRFFYMNPSDYFAYVKDNQLADPDRPAHTGIEDVVEVREPADQTDVVEAAEECPGMCIYIEVVDASPAT